VSAEWDEMLRWLAGRAFLLLRLTGASLLMPSLCSSSFVLPRATCITRFLPRKNLEPAHSSLSCLNLTLRIACSSNTKARGKMDAHSRIDDNRRSFLTRPCFFALVSATAQSKGGERMSDKKRVKGQPA
jgi:hypothetical protein